MKKESQRPKTKDQRLLYLDTSEMMTKLAIFEDGNKIAEEKWEAGRELSKTLTERYSHILKNVRMTSSELDGIAVFIGPGSFTGLRIGISFANGLAFALGIPIFETREKEKFEVPKSAKGGSSSGRKFAVPFYGSEPKITKPKGA